MVLTNPTQKNRSPPLLPHARGPSNAGHVLACGELAGEVGDGEAPCGRDHRRAGHLLKQGPGRAVQGGSTGAESMTGCPGDGDVVLG